MVFQPTAPALKGLVQKKTQDNKYENKGDVSLWKYTPEAPSTTDKPQPTFKGFITINGEKYNISVWDN